MHVHVPRGQHFSSQFDEEVRIHIQLNCLTSLPVWLTACTPCTALRSQEQQKRFNPCCLLSPPPPPLFPPPPSLWRRHAHVSQSHVTFYCGISDCSYVLGWNPGCPTITCLLTPEWDRSKAQMMEHVCSAGRYGLTSPCCDLRSFIIRMYWVQM